MSVFQNKLRLTTHPTGTIAHPTGTIAHPTGTTAHPTGDNPPPPLPLPPPHHLHDGGECVAPRLRGGFLLESIITQPI